MHRYVVRGLGAWLSACVGMWVIKGSLPDSIRIINCILVFGISMYTIRRESKNGNQK